MERFMGVGIFEPARGGDPLLYQHMFWFYSHPAVYIMILPAMGVASELIAPFARRPIFGYAGITEAQARRWLRYYGYTGIVNLHVDQNGHWQAQATHNGRRVKVALDDRGTATEQK